LLDESAAALHGAAPIVSGTTDWNIVLLVTRTFEPLRSLERPDKHFLGTGEGVLYAPPFPLFPDSGGFWDVFHYHVHALSPGFTWTLLDERGLPLRLERKRREWTPARIRTTF